MTILDANLSYYLTRGLFIIILFYVMWKYIRPQLRNIYEHVFAYFLNRGMKKLNKKLDGQKKLLFQSLSEQALKINRPKGLSLLEIGIGGGSNFQYYPSGTEVIGVDPNPNFKKYISENVKKCPNVTVKELIVAKAEDLGQMPENHVDAIVSTLVLCSVDELELSVNLMKRVLKQGGKLYYIEHVADENGSFRNWLQIFITPLLRQVSCELTRDTGSVIERAGFSHVKHTKFLAPLGWLGWVIQPLLIGEATK